MNHRARDVSRLCTESDARRQLSKAARHRVRDDAIQADRAEHEAEHAERGEHPREERAPLALPVVSLEPPPNSWAAQPRARGLERDED
jgi:hypothetical protein